MKFLTFVDLHLDKKGLKELVERAKKSDINFSSAREMFLGLDRDGKIFLRL